jgi:hypothetical protein
MEKLILGSTCKAAEEKKTVLSFSSDCKVIVLKSQREFFVLAEARTGLLYIMRMLPV